MIKKVSALIALATSIVALAVPGSSAAATSTQLSIETNAQYLQNGFQIAVQLHATCDGGFGFVQMQVFQAPPENQFPTQGFGGTGVFCDGQQHQVAVTVFAQGAPFDVGKATAFATLFSSFGQATASKTINITF
jgi:uncharacterized protein (DUF2141 family)